MSLSREGVLKAALALVDRDGLDGLTMRKLGAELGVEAMSLYRYVTSKSDLLDGVFEVVSAQVLLPDPSGDWPSDARIAGRGFYAVLTQHPHALPLFATRPAVTPASLRTLERALALLGQRGTSVDESLSMFNVIFSYILGFAMLQAPQLEAVVVDYAALDGAELPRLSTLRGVLDAYDVASEFERGLDAVVAGLAVRY